MITRIHTNILKRAIFIFSIEVYINISSNLF